MQTETNTIEYPVVNIEEPEYCKLKVHYEADPEIVGDKIKEAIKSLRSIKIPGFRPGKAPDYAIKAKLKPQINQFVAREMASEAVDDIIFKTDIKTIGTPNFYNVVVKGKSFSCDIDLMKKPDITIDNFVFEVPKPILLDPDTLTEKALMNIRMRLGETIPYGEDDVVELGDQVTLSAIGEINGIQVEPLIIAGELYVVGQTNKWAGFDDQLTGIKSGESKQFDLTFTNGLFAGQTAKFDVTVHMGTKTKPTDINEEFLNTCGVSSLEELLAQLKAISVANAEVSSKSAIRNQVAIKLVESVSFEVPASLIETEAQNIVMQNNLSTHGSVDEDQMVVIKQQAERNIKLSLILDTIRDKEPDSVLNDAEAYNNLSQHLVKQGQNPDEFYKDKRRHPQIASFIHSIKEEFTLQWVADQAKIVE